jgi:hypothetical protein
MNGRAVIFQRDTLPLQLRGPEERYLEAYARARGLRRVSTYVASGQQYFLTIDVLIDHCLLREQAGHLILSDLSLLWTGEGLQDVLDRLKKADTILHVVPSETR